MAAGFFLSLPVGMTLRWVSDLNDQDTVSAAWVIYPGSSVCGVMSVILHKDRCHGHANIWLVEQTRVRKLCLSLRIEFACKTCAI